MKYHKDGSNVLDGSQSHKDLVTPFDAHEQATRGVHVPTREDSPDVKDVQEYPKAVDHREVEPVPGGPKHLEPVIAKDADHEKELKANGESSAS